MAEDNPKHADGFDSIKDIKIIWFVAEDFEWLGVVESLQYLIGSRVLFFFFRSHTSQESYQA